MKIHSGLNNKCVDRAISTARAVCGLDPLEKIDIPKDRCIKNVIRYLGRHFPNMDVFVWVDPVMLPREMDNNICYCGTELTYDFDDSEYVFMYAYYCLKLNEGHLVLGLPAFSFSDPVKVVFAIRMERNNVN